MRLIKMDGIWRLFDHDGFLVVSGTMEAVREALTNMWGN